MSSPATPMRPSGSGGAPASAALPLLDNAPHCLRRGALQLPARRSERDPCYDSDRLLALDNRGIALIVMLLTMGLLSALGVALVLATTAETRIAANFRMAQQTLYAADAAVERALDDLMAVTDWNVLLADGVLSPFVDGPPGGVRQLVDGSTVDLTEAVNLANCQKTAACSDADMNAVTEDRPWGSNNPRWKLFAYGWLRNIVSAPGIDPPQYLIVMTGDDPGEVDNDPARDAAAGTSGAGTVALRAEAFGPGGAHKVVEVTLMRGERAIRIVSWREVR